MATADPGVGSWTPINIFAMIRALANNGCPIVSNAGAPVNGTSGTFALTAGPGSILIDYTNANIYVNVGTLASPTWVLFGGSSNSFTPQAADGAIPVTPSKAYVITKGSAAALTIAAPTVDNVDIIITSDTAFAHVLTFTGGTLDSGNAAVLTATWNAFKGASLEIISYNGRWKVLNANGVGLS